MARNLLVATNPAKRRTRKQTLKQRAASIRNLRKARSARKRPKRRNPSRTSAKTTARRTPRRTARRRLAVRRNPVRRKTTLKGIVDRQVMPALIGGTGAVVNDVAYNFLMNNIPATVMPTFIEQLRTGPLRHVAKASSALALAWLAGMALPRRTADQLGAGAVTVVGYNVVRDVLAKVAPDLTLGAYIEPGLAWAGPGRSAPGTLPSKGSNFRRSGLEAYLSPRLRGLPQLTQRGQLSQPNPYTSRRPARSSESYGEDLGT